jgi:hypothetical protein
MSRADRGLGAQPARGRQRRVHEARVLLAPERSQIETCLERRLLDLLARAGEIVGSRPLTQT